MGPPRNCKIVALRYARASRVILPIHRSIGAVVHLVRKDSIECRTGINTLEIKILHIIVGIHQIELFVYIADAQAAGECYNRFFPAGRLRRDEDHAVGALRAIDRSRRCIFENLHRSDVLGIDSHQTVIGFRHAGIAAAMRAYGD